MRARVLSIGSELLRGDIVDTNAAYLTRELSMLGFQVRGVEQVGDDLALLTDAVRRTMADAEITVCTGGLGPTQDDLTREAVSAALDEEMTPDPLLVAELEARFASLRRPMPASNAKQATLIPSAESIPNPNGSAPGWYAEKTERRIIAMPGPPAEMMPMWREQVRPRLERLFPGSTAMLGLMTFGIGESHLEQMIKNIIGRDDQVTVATYAKLHGVQVHITARAATAEAAGRLVAGTERDIRARLGRAVYGTGEDTLSSAVGRLLTSRGQTVAVMESATGGILSSNITDEPGSSQHFIGGIVAYSRELKAAGGVPIDIMEAHGLISAETAEAMARAARTRLGADAGVGVTGIAGEAEVEGKPPGTCYVAVAVEDRTQVREVHRPGRRETAKRFFAQCALDLLRRELEHDGETTT